MEAISVPVVSLISAVSLMGTFCEWFHDVSFRGTGWHGRQLTNLARESANILATSWPSTLGAPKPLVQRINSGSTVYQKLSRDADILLTAVVNSFLTEWNMTRDRNSVDIAVLAGKHVRAGIGELSHRRLAFNMHCLLPGTSTADLQ